MLAMFKDNIPFLVSSINFYIIFYECSLKQVSDYFGISISYASKLTQPDILSLHCPLSWNITRQILESHFPFPGAPICKLSKKNNTFFSKN